MFIHECIEALEENAVEMTMHFSLSELVPVPALYFYAIIDLW